MHKTKLNIFYLPIASGRVKIHDFDHSVNAPNSINVTCEESRRWDGLPDWTWYAEGFSFFGPLNGSIPG